jgi:ABC-2 type transport system ATP-binding protein
MGKTVIVSSHILPELADICNKIGIIDKGELQVSAAVTDVMNQVRDQTVLHVGVDNNIESAVAVLQQNDLVSTVEHGDGHLVVTLNSQTKEYSRLATDLINNGIGLNLFQEEEVSLESAFMTLTKGAGAKI